MKNKVFRIIITVILIAVMLLPRQVYAAKYEYDKLDRVTKVTYDDGSSVEYKYDANGNIVDIVVIKKSSESDIPSGGGGTSGGKVENPDILDNFIDELPLSKVVKDSMKKILSDNPLIHKILLKLVDSLTSKEKSIFINNFYKLSSLNLDMTPSQKRKIYKILGLEGESR